MGFVPESRKESEKLKQVLKFLLRHVSDGLGADEWKTTVTGCENSTNGPAGYLETRTVCSEKDREQLHPGMRLNPGSKLRHASDREQDLREMFRQINRNLTRTVDYGKRQSKWELVKAGSHLCFYTF